MQLAISTIRRITILTASVPRAKQKLAVTELQRGLIQLGYARRFIISELPGPMLANNELRFVLVSGRATAEDYVLSAFQDGPSATVTIEGASDQALLYGVFDFLAQQGTYFGTDGELYPLEHPDAFVMPDENHPWTRIPRLSTRGLMPWPDFLNCITVFNREDLRAYLESMLRMRMNTLGLHVYGQQHKWAESFLSFEYGGVGHTAFTDTTATDRWGYLPQRTSRYGMSAAQYYDGDVFGSDATRQARNPWEAAELAQSLWREMFNYAEELGIHTGIGFEPFQLPDEIIKACPPEVRFEQSYQVPWQTEDLRIARLDPESRTARHILETRLAGLLETYPSISHVYLWEDEISTWASQRGDVPLSLTPFKQAHDFLRRHAPDKRLVLAGWGGIVRHFERLHRELPGDIIFAALSDQVGWDPINEAFGKLDDRERWPIPWIEDDPSSWFPQLHVNRFDRDITLAEQYGCQGILGVHWRHRITDPVVSYFGRRGWTADLTPEEHYRGYARTQARGERAAGLADILTDMDTNRRLLSTWTGELRPDGHSLTVEFSGDYDEAFLIHRDYDISDDAIQGQAYSIDQLGELYRQAKSPDEADRLGYWAGQLLFVHHYARAWQLGRQLHTLIATKDAGAIREQAVPIWTALLDLVRQAVLSYQHTVATRGDLGTLASMHNKFVRIATFRLRASLLEYLDTLPAEAESAWKAALAPDTGLDGRLIVPTRPTRLAPGETVRITAIAPGIRDVSEVRLRWRPIGLHGWTYMPMALVGRRTYTAELSMPIENHLGIEYGVVAVFAGAPDPLIVSAPAQGAYLITV